MSYTVRHQDQKMPQQLKRIPPKFPIRALLPRPDDSLPKTCTSTITQGFLASPLEWLIALATSRPFPKPNDGCMECIDRHLLAYIGKRIKLADHHGEGTITAVDHFENDEVIMKVEGDEVQTIDHIAYLAIPRDKVSLNLFDEIRYRLTIPDGNAFKGDHIWVEREQIATMMVTGD